MKKNIIALLLSFVALATKAQFLNEVQLLDGKMYVEMSNPEGGAVSSVKITFANTDTVVYATQKEIDSLNKKGAFVVLSFPEVSGIHDGDNLLNHAVYAIVNDKDTTRLTWFCVCQICDGYSLSRMYESPGIPMLHYYGYEEKTDEEIYPFSVVSRPTIGKPNVRDSILVNRRGRLLHQDKTPFRNTSFILTKNYNFDGSDTLKTDAEGNFSIYTMPGRDGKGCGDGGYAGYRLLKIFDGINDDNEMFIITPYFQAYPGIVYVDLDDVGINSVNTASLIPLTLSPNPARETVAVGYELPTGSDSRSFRITLISESGRTARTEPLRSVSGTQDIQLGGFPRGTYRCIIHDEDGTVIGSENLIVE